MAQKKETQKDILEAYCSTEVSKMLFDAGYHGDNVNGIHLPGDEYDIVEYYVSISCAMRWLRETHGVYINVRVNPICELVDDVRLNFVIDILDYRSDRWISTDNEILTDTYEEAAEAAIKYSIENIIRNRS